MEAKVKLNCKYCGSEYILSEIKRIYSKDSAVYQLGLCSASCYTKKVTS